MFLLNCQGLGPVTSTLLQWYLLGTVMKKVATATKVSAVSDHDFRVAP